MRSERNRARGIGVVFDLFGTLVPKWNSERSLEAKFAMAAQLGLPAGEFCAVWDAAFWERELGRGSLESSVRRVALAVDAPISDARIERALAIWFDLCRAGIQARNPEVLSTLRTLRARGFRVGLISNCGPVVPAPFRQSPLAELIDHATFSCRVGVAKPERRIYEIHCRELGIDPHGSIYVGDGGSDELRGAQAVGFRPLLLRVDEEIAREGLPDAVDDWKGEELRNVHDLLDCLPTEGAGS